MRLISLSTIFGIFLGFGLFGYAIWEGTNKYFIFWSLSSLLLVLGGTLAATMISYEGRYVWRALGTLAQVIAPGFGMIGTLVGLIVMLSELDGGTGGLGQGLALALITTLYGVILAQLVFKPASRRAEQKEQMLRFKHQLTIDAFLLLVNRANSFEIQDHLNSYLDPAIQFNSAQD